MWTSCGREGREAEEEAAAGYRTKNKNPTQRCGEKMLSQILPRQLPTCPSRNKVDFCQNKPYFDKNRPYFLTGNDGNQKLARLSFQDKPHSFLVAIVARQEIRSIFVKNKAYFGKNRPYFLTGRWAAAWAKFGSTFFPHIFVWGYCFWFCIPPPPFWLPPLPVKK